MPAATFENYDNFNVEEAESTLQKIGDESGIYRDFIEHRVNCWLGTEKYGNWLEWAKAYPLDNPFIDRAIKSRAQAILSTYDTLGPESICAMNSMIKYAPQLARAATNAKTFASLNHAYEGLFKVRTKLESESYCIEKGLDDERDCVRTLEEQAISCDEQSLTTHMKSLGEAIKSNVKRVWKNHAQPWLEEVEGEEFRSDILPLLKRRVERQRQSSRKR